MTSRKSRQLNTIKPIFIFCEGETEKNYFKMLRKKYRKRNITINLKDLGSNGDGLVKRILSSTNVCRRTKPNCDIYLCFDRDALSTSELQTEIKLAKENKLEIIYSNVCFEVWILSHFKKISTELSTNDMYIELSKLLGVTNYTKCKACNFSDKLNDRVKTALENTENFEELKNDAALLNQNPYTNVGLEIKRIFNLKENKY